MTAAASGRVTCAPARPGPIIPSSLPYALAAARRPGAVALLPAPAERMAEWLIGMFERAGGVYQRLPPDRVMPAGYLSALPAPPTEQRRATFTASPADVTFMGFVFD